MRRLPSASHLELAEYCVWPWAGAGRWPERPSSPAAAYGIAFHLVVARLVTGQPPKVEEVAAKHELLPADERRLAASIPRIVDFLEGDLGVRGEAEVGLVFNLSDGRARTAERTAPRGPDELYGAADHIVPRADGKLVVRDWKTGERAKGKAPRETRQLRFLALAAARVWGATEVRVELAFVDEDGAELVGDDLDALDLMIVEGELAQLQERVEAPPRPVPGPWCDRYYCPTRATCPATLAALEPVLKALRIEPLLTEIRDASHAAFIRHRLPVVQEWVEAREMALKDWTKRHGPLPVEDKPALRWGPVEHEGRERIEPTPEALAIVREKLGEHADEALEVSLSKASIERGVRAALAARYGARAPRGALGKMVVPMLEALRTARAVKRGSAYTKFEEFKVAGAVPCQATAGGLRCELNEHGPDVLHTCMGITWREGSVTRSGAPA